MGGWIDSPYLYCFTRLTRLSGPLFLPLPSPSHGIGTSMLLLPPRWVQQGDKSDLGKTRDCCLRCDGLEVTVPSRSLNFPRPNPNAAALTTLFPRISAGFQSHAAACSTRSDARGRTDSCSAPNQPSRTSFTPSAVCEGLRKRGQSSQNSDSIPNS